MFWLWAFEKQAFWMIVIMFLEKLPTYLFHRGSVPNIVRKKSFEFFFFLNEVSFWGIVIGPLKRLPMYFSHRGSSLDVVQKKSFEKWIFFLSNLLRMRFFEILSFLDEQKVILWTISLTNHSVELLTQSHWLIFGLNNLG